MDDVFLEYVILVMISMALIPMILIQLDGDEGKVYEVIRAVLYLCLILALVTIVTVGFFSHWEGS